MRALLGLIVLCLAWPSFSSVSFADDHDVADSPSVFAYGYRGFYSGALAGTGAGYLVARHDGVHGEDWRTLVLGGGIGALTGSAVGVSLGLLDLSVDEPGRGHVVLRDMAYGATFGLFAGTASGALAAVRTRDAEHILFGSAVGAIVGTGLGLAVGWFDGERWSERRARRQRDHHHHARGLSASLSTTEDATGALVWLPGVSGRI